MLFFSFGFFYLLLAMSQGKHNRYQQTTPHSDTFVIIIAILILYCTETYTPSEIVHYYRFECQTS